MITFFKHLGIGIISAFTAFTGAFHSQTPATTTATQANASSSQVTINTAIESNSTPAKQEVQKATVTRAPTGIVNATIFNPAQSVPTATDYYSYQNLPSEFAKNPPFYVGSKVKLSGQVVDFMAAGDRGGSSNYVEIRLQSSASVSYFALAIDATNYQRIAKNIDKYDSITAYGVISSSRTFLNADQFTTTLMPVLTVIRVDKCNGSDACVVSPGAQTIFPVTNVPNVISNEQVVSLGAAFLNPQLYVDTRVTTGGTVTRVLRSDTNNDSLIFIQDPIDGRGTAFFSVDSAFIINNQIKVGSKLTIKGTLVLSGNPVAASAVNEFHLLNASGFYITDGTINLN